jgi:competence CoiA-like predicted nuclease
MYEPRQVPLGKACGCICPSCKSPLVAKNALNNHRIPHFAHASGENCVHGRESAIHLAAKQLIEEHHKLYIPERIVKIYIVDEMKNEHSPQKILIRAGLVDFSRV